MRILHVSAYYAPAFVYGGPPRSIHGLCRALRGLGADVRVFTTDANGGGALPAAVTSAGEYDGVPVTYFARTWPRRLIGSRPLDVALREALPTVDVLHVHGLWNRVVWSATREARRAGVPYVLSPRGMLEAAALAHHGWRKRAAHAILERRTIHGAAVVHATSEREAESVRHWRPDARVVLIPNGIDVDLSRTSAHTPAPTFSRADLGLPVEAPLVLFLGRLHPIKRVDLLVDAFTHLKTRHPGAALVIAGPDEFELRASLTTRAGAAAGSIVWMGPVDAEQRDSLLRHASALVSCSDSESFGMSVLEAMAAAVPVVVTKTCGWPDVQTHRAGFIVDQRADAIAGALAAILEDPQAAVAMGTRACDLTRSTYRWEAIATTFMREYDSLATGRPRTALAS